MYRSEPTSGPFDKIGRLFRPRASIRKKKLDTLKTKLNIKLFGQHIAVKEVFKSLNDHATNKNPTKALAMICNGSLGTGKTFFANCIADCLGEGNQKNVKQFVGPRDFPDSSKVRVYQQKLKEDIETQVKKNPRTIFIFDEVDKMPANMLDALAPYVDTYENLQGVDYRKCVFLFLSNTGGTRIDEIVLRLSAEGKRREHLLLFHFQQDLDEIVFNEKGGLKGSEIIKKRLIDQYVPFLPLEKEHIVACLGVEYNRLHDSFNGLPVDLHRIAEMFEYYPKENPIFSTEGAKNVSVKMMQAREFITNHLELPRSGSSRAQHSREQIGMKLD